MGLSPLRTVLERRVAIYGYELCQEKRLSHPACAPQLYTFNKNALTFRQHGEINERTSENLFLAFPTGPQQSSTSTLALCQYLKPVRATLTHDLPNRRYSSKTGTYCNLCIIPFYISVTYA